MGRRKTKRGAAKPASIAPDGLPLSQRSPPSSPTHRIPDFFELSEYDFEELCEQLVRYVDGVERASPKNRRGNPQFGIDIEGFSVLQKPSVVLSAKREKTVSKGKIKRWSDDFLKHIDGHWKGKGVERFILGCAAELRDDAVNSQISEEAQRFALHAIGYEAWDNREIVQRLRSRRDLVEIYFHHAWVDRICGSETSSGPIGRGRANTMHGGVTVAKITALGERLVDSVRRELDYAQREARAWRGHALDEVLGRIRDDPVQWENLPNGDKARVLRLSAARALALNALDDARRMRNDAAAFHEPEDRVLDALIVRAEGDLPGALKLLDVPLNDNELHTRAGLMIEAGQPLDALQLLGTRDPNTTSQNLEVLRLTMLGWVMARRPAAAIEILTRASNLDAADVSLAWAAAVAYFNAALAHGAEPVLGRCPNPIERSLFREDRPALQHLDEAARRFAGLASTVAMNEREDLEVWELAALSSHPTRADGAEVKARQLLSRASPHPGAVAWALARGYDVPAGKVRKSYRDLLATDRATASHLAVLLGLELSIGQVKKAERLLAAEAFRFTGPDDRALIAFWAGEVNRVAAKSPLTFELPPSLREMFDAALAGCDPKPLADAVAAGPVDARIITEVAHELTNAGRYEAVSALGISLIALGTPRAVALAARAALKSGAPERTLDILRDHAGAFRGGRLPLSMVRLQIEAAWQMGNVRAALDHAQRGAPDESLAEISRDLAVMHAQAGDFRGAAFQLQKLPSMEGLSGREAVAFARTLRSQDPDLSERLLRRAAEELGDPAVVAEGMRLALDLQAEELDRVFRSAMERHAKRGGPAPIRSLSFEQAQVVMQDIARGRQRASQLWLKGRVPLHVAFGESPEMVAHLFDGARSISDGRAPLISRCGGRDELPLMAPIGEWDLHLDVTALLLADALGLLDRVSDAVRSLAIPPSLPETLHHLEDAVRPIQEHLRAAEADLHAAVVTKAITIVPDADLGDRVIVQPRSKKRVGLSFSDLVATLERCCGVDRTRLPVAGGGRGSHELVSPVKPGAKLVVDYGNLVQLSSTGGLDALLEHFDVAIRRSEVEALAQMVEDARHGREMADRIARLRERTADRLISGDWRLLRHHPDPKENSGPPLQRCLHELLLAIGEEGSRAWIEDRQVSSFSTINNQIPITSIEEVLAALLEAKAVSTIEWIEARRVLRRLGYAFLPFDEEELLAALAAAPIHDHGLIETDTLALLRRHFALQLDALEHAQVGQDFRLPDGRTDDSGIIAHLHGLWRRTMPAIWGRFAGDRSRRLSAADWVLNNLRVDTFVKGPFADRTTAVLESLRQQVAGWLLVQAIVITGDGSWEVKRELIVDYVHWMMQAVVKPLVESEAAAEDAIATALAAWALHAAEPLPGMIDELGAERADAVMLTSAKIILVEFPVEWANLLATKSGFTERFGPLVLDQILLGERSCDASRFWRAAESAFATGRGAMVCDNPTGTVTLVQQVREGEPPALLIEIDGTKGILNDVAAAVAHPDPSVRLEILSNHIDWFDAVAEDRAYKVRAIASIGDVVERMDALDRARHASVTWRLRRLRTELRNPEKIDWSLIEPPAERSVEDHLCLDSETEILAPDALRNAVHAMRSNQPPPSIAARLAGLPVDPPPEVLLDLADWLGEDAEAVASRFQEFANTPMRARLAARAILIHRAHVAGLRERCLGLMIGTLEEVGGLYRSILRWTARVAARRPSWRARGARRRAMLVWCYADSLTATFVSENIDHTAAAQIFDEREPLHAGDLRWQVVDSGSLA